MQARDVPAVGPRYWTAIALASVFGANLGDFVSHTLHGGHWRGLPPLAAVFAAILLAERRAARPTEAYYWLAIVTLRTAATNLADLATHDLRLGYAPVIAALAALLAALLRLDRRPATGLPPTGPWYWAAMLVAGTLGTAAGDAVADELGLGVGLGSLVLAAVLLALLALRQVLPTRTTYWTSIVAVRTTGTTAGDLAAHTLGLSPSTACTGLALLATLAAWRDPTRLRATPPVAGT